MGYITNLETKIWIIPQTKNGDPQVVVLTDNVVAIFKSRTNNESDYIFPSQKDKTRPLINSKKAWQRIINRAGITNLRIHDLRRTLGSWQAITGSSLPVIGKSLGHKTPEATAIYARLSLDPVRESVEKATQAMLAAAKKTGHQETQQSIPANGQYFSHKLSVTYNVSFNALNIFKG